MIRSLVLQVLWAPAVLLVVAATLVLGDLYGGARARQRFAAVSEMDRQLDRSLSRLKERHERTVRRTREALLETRKANQVAILAPTAEHYLQEMERYASEAAAVFARIAIPDGDPRLETDVAHLTRQVERVFEQVQEMVPALEALLEAVENEDAEALRLAQQEFDRTDKAVTAGLGTASRMAQLAITVQANHAVSAPPLIPAWGWAATLLLAILALTSAFLPLRRIAKLALGETVAARTREETLIRARLEELATERGALERGLGDRTRELEKATQVSRRTEQELALLRLYNDNLVNSLRSAILVTDASGKLTGFNRAARLGLGLDAKSEGIAVIDHPLSRALAARGTDVNAELERAMREREALRFDGVSFRRGDTELLLDLTVVPYLDESGAARGLLWVADDVTDAVQVRRQLLAAERLAAVGSLSAQVAHEVRNPLSAIGLNAELLEEEFSHGLAEPKRAEAAALLRAIAREVERLTQITEGYLKLARLPHPELREVDLNGLVTDLTAVLGQELKAHRIEVHMDLATPSPRAWGDPGQLRQALLNIVRNSREAMGAGGTLHIRTRKAADTVSLEVSDTGPGIPTDVLPRVLEPFFTTKPDGTGLGLSLASQIITEHGGNIDVSSVPGRSTNVTLSLPASTASNKAV
jgi:PAS domain S-box-containing protein